MSASSPDWLLTTVSAVRELMIKRIEADSVDREAKRDMEMALEELDVMWEKLQGQAALLARESERYADFFEFAPDACLISDSGGSIREANQAALELLGAAREDLAGMALSEFVAEEDRADFLARTVSPMLGTGAKTLAWQARLLRRSGAALRAELSVRAIPLKRSGVAGLCWLIRPLES